MSLLVALWSLVACSGRTPTPSGQPPQDRPAPTAPIDFDAPPAEEGLKIELYDAEPASGPSEAIPTPPTSSLSKAQIDTLLGRVPALEGAEGDRKTFAMRPGSKPPPLPGSDVQTAFPPPEAPALGEADAAKPLEVVRFAPEGDVPMAPHVSLTFNQPMVAVTSQARAEETVPATMTPAVAGKWRWLGTRTLLFEGEAGAGRLPMATDYTVEVPTSAQSSAGKSLAAPFRFTFATPPVTLVDHLVGGEPMGLEPVVLLAFDQAVEPGAVLEHLKVTGPGVPSVHLATDTELAEAGAGADRFGEQVPAERVVALAFAEPLAKASAFGVTVAAGTPSAEGPKVTAQDQSLASRPTVRSPSCAHTAGGATSAAPARRSRCSSTTRSTRPGSMRRRSTSSPSSRGCGCRSRATACRSPAPPSGAPCTR
ncbi:MAG: Ig-like domain-containing protein [Myxococcota bacterium]